MPTDKPENIDVEVPKAGIGFADMSLQRRTAMVISNDLESAMHRIAMLAMLGHNPDWAMAMALAEQAASLVMKGIDEYEREHFKRMEESLAKGRRAYAKEIESKIDEAVASKRADDQS
jgi:hypothetical protein